MALRRVTDPNGPDEDLVVADAKALPRRPAGRGVGREGADVHRGIDDDEAIAETPRAGVAIGHGDAPRDDGVSQPANKRHAEAPERHRGAGVVELPHDRNATAAAGDGALRVLDAVHLHDIDACGGDEVGEAAYVAVSRGQEAPLREGVRCGPQAREREGVYLDARRAEAVRRLVGLLGEGRDRFDPKVPERAVKAQKLVVGARVGRAVDNREDADVPVRAADHGRRLPMIRLRLVPRPPISVVVPFRGNEAEASALLDALGGLALAPGDEVLVVDNGAGGTFGNLRRGNVEIADATAEYSSYYARNIGAERTAAPWILFIDSDCIPAPGILDGYFAPEPAVRCGVLAGAVRGAPGASLAARYAAARGHLDETFHLAAEPYPAGITANLLVRRRTWETLGGFQEGVRSGADVEFCWRAQDAGWGLEHRPRARVEHRHADSLRELLRKAARYGAGRRWVNRRYPGSMPRPRLARELVRAVAGGVAWPLAGQPTRGAFKLIDGAYVAAGAWGYVAGDSSAEPAARQAHRAARPSS